MRAKRVGCNLLWLAPGRVGGSEEYCVRLLEACAERSDDDDDLDLRLFVNRRFADAYPDLVARFPTDVAPIEGEHRGPRVIAENTWLARACRARGIDLVHHLGGTMPYLAPAPGMVLVHALQPWAMPSHFSRLKRGYLRATVPRSARRAVAVTTLSQWVRHDVNARLGVALDRIVAVPPGAGPVRPVSDEVTDEVLARYELGDRPFFVYPAITYPHKNHLTLLQAFARVAASDERPALVLSGGAAGSEGEVTAAVAELGLTARVRRPGRIPAVHLDVLYREATALTLPSRYEGFGMPVLEAMSRGCPVVASRSCALPEVVGDGGLLLDPDDVDAWARTMTHLLADEGERARWAASAAQRANDFRWDDAARALVDLYLHGPPAARSGGS
jgi:glycosyltransferase involved in cell wall biosynthesis